MEMEMQSVMKQDHLWEALTQLLKLIHLFNQERVTVKVDLDLEVQTQLLSTQVELESSSSKNPKHKLEETNFDLFSIYKIFSLIKL